MKIPTSLCLNNIKNVKIIRATLKTYRIYANKIPYQIDHDFRNLRKLVWHFYDFSMIYYEFHKIPVLVEKKKTKKKEEDRLDQFWPSSAHKRRRRDGRPASVACPS